MPTPASTGSSTRSTATEPSILYSGRFKAYTGTVLRTRAIDRVGNAGPVASRALDIDVSGDPTAPALTLRLEAVYGTEVREGTVYFTPGSPQSFTVEAIAEDPESGIAAITYPDIPGWTRSGGTYERGPSAVESGPHIVRVTNHAGRTSRDELQDRVFVSLRASLIACSSRSRARMSVKRSEPCSG